jgi:hypothetical protein
VKNPILNWSWDKPTQDGLYLACRGDVETEANIQPFRLVQSCADCYTGSEWPVYNKDDIVRWHTSFKFAKLCFGIEAGE